MSKEEVGEIEPCGGVRQGWVTSYIWEKGVKRMNEEEEEDLLYTLYYDVSKRIFNNMYIRSEHN